ncbi:MAG TPA: tetratricopeptide repeat protein [Candidatus Udaeobacter sp.]|nr:tetratricopeptide repeat protein [Candidatus Udaeobacter sp.]
MKIDNFFAELKRRNVLKVAVAYIIAGWALSQGIAQVFPVFDVPNWLIRLLVVLIIVGLPVAVFFAWYFELTPEGIRRTAVADAMPASAKPKKYLWIYVVAIGAAVSIALFFLGRYTAQTPRPASEELRRGGQSEAATVPQKSIAVLPFDNLSRDPDNAYFTEGVQDEILTRLAKVADLKVISRTSTQHFKSTPDNLPQIAKQLGVAHILEGSVQKANDHVRVNVQLINALTDAHLWADTYDRKLTDIFAVETEIAKTVADVLQAKLTGSEQHVIAARPTSNTEAHQLYLKGRFFWNKRTGNDLKKSIDYFQQAIAADPNYALAYAGVADAYVLIPGYSGGNPRDCYPKAIAAAKKALELDDTLVEARTSLALAIWYYDFDFSQANREFQRAIELNPNYAIAHQQYGNNTLSATGRFNDAIAEGKRAVELDPLSLVINADLGVDYYYARRYDEAIAQLRKLLEMDPGYYFAYITLGQALEMKGARDAAIAEYQKARALNDDPSVLALLAHAYGLSGNKMEAEKILDQLKALSKARYVSAYSFALANLGLGNKEEALRWLEQSYQDRAGADVGWIRVDPLLDPLRGDRRFEALAEKIVPAAEFKSPTASK